MFAWWKGKSILKEQRTKEKKKRNDAGHQQQVESFEEAQQLQLSISEVI